DFHVTGVQTCALPIYRRRRRALRTAAGILIAVGIITALEYLLLLRVLPDELARGASAPADAQDQAVRDAALRAVRLIFSGFVGRSEERRVGKERVARL